MSKILYFFFLKFQLSISQYVQFNVNVSFTYFLAVLNKKNWATADRLRGSLCISGNARVCNCCQDHWFYPPAILWWKLHGPTKVHESLFFPTWSYLTSSLFLSVIPWQLPYDSHVPVAFLLFFIARQHTDARYWYSKSVCPSVRLSVRLSVTFRYQIKTA